MKTLLILSAILIVRVSATDPQLDLWPGTASVIVYFNTGWSNMVLVDTESIIKTPRSISVWVRDVVMNHDGTIDSCTTTRLKFDRLEYTVSVLQMIDKEGKILFCSKNQIKQITAYIPPNSYASYAYNYVVNEYYRGGKK
jgi:hypothetical protein